MDMAPFYERFQIIAEKETRVITLPSRMMGLPADEYALVEFYCETPGCDCRKVIIQVWSSKKPGVSLGTFDFGWESEEFYIRWMHGDEMGRRMAGLSIAPMSAQSQFTPALMALVGMVLREDPAYVARLKRHYQMVKGSCLSDW